MIANAVEATHGEHRKLSATPLNLVEIDRAVVVNAVTGDAVEEDGVYAVGAMRELCPHCRTNHLKLVLRQKRVSQSHLYCEVCIRCFDARHLDGSSALEMGW